MYELYPSHWLRNTLIGLVIVAAVSWSATSVKYSGLAAKGVEVATGIVHGITHPDMNLLLSTSTDGVPYLLLQTIAIAILGTIFGSILAIPFSFLASENIVPKWVAYIVRVFILLIRTIPTLVWALMWIRVTGPGPFCGVMTQSICSMDTHILESLDAMGCNTFEKIRYGIIPQLTANFISSSIYRFDINMKDATTLGIVGAGGIGASLGQCLNSRRWSMVGSFIFGLMIFVLIVEFISTRIRTKLAHG